jgi:uncharacterized protein (DUF58 family)
MIVDTALLRRLEQLSLVARRVRAGQTAGERRSTKRGTSVEFADYRDYAKGDDLRRVDWNIYARLERPFVKLFEEEEDLAVHLLLDGSASMDWGAEGQGEGETGRGETRGQGEGGQGDEERGNKGTRGGRTGGRGERGHGDRGMGGRGDWNKWAYARRLAAALGYVALASGDRLTVSNLQSPTSNLQPPTSNLRSPISNLQPQFGPVRGRGHTLRLFEWLEELEAAGMTDLNASLRAYGIAGGRAGLVVLVSDLLSPAGYVEGLSQLAVRGHEVAVVHVLSPDEVEPPLGGDLRLLDVETGDHQEVTIDGGMRALYRRRLAAWRGEIRATCRARDVHYVPVETDTPVDRVVLYDLRRVGLVR